jgi:hypothetical protein
VLLRAIVECHEQVIEKPPSILNLEVNSSDYPELSTKRLVPRKHLHEEIGSNPILIVEACTAAQCCGSRSIWHPYLSKASNAKVVPPVQLSIMTGNFSAISLLPQCFYDAQIYPHVTTRSQILLLLSLLCTNQRSLDS